MTDEDVYKELKEIRVFLAAKLMDIARRISAAPDVALTRTEQAYVEMINACWEALDSVGIPLVEEEAA